ncbi:MAG: C39 family peptidase [Acidobacteria bacterium]|nr:C39 family peptidase [Acidobacteriota bacterium]
MLPAILLLAPAPQAPPRLPARALPVPTFRQSTGYACGASALQAVLYYWRVYGGQESKLYPLLGTTPELGTPPEGLVAGARSFGLSAHLKEGVELAELRQALTTGQTVILNLQAWSEAPARKLPWKDRWEDGHYVVLVGMDETHLYVMDPSTGLGYAYLPIPEFLDRWHDRTQVGGRWREFRRLAIFIQGKTPLDGTPAPLTRLE